MKRLKLFALGLIGASMVMTSCADDSDDPAVPPTLTVTEENSANGVVDGKVNTSADTLRFAWDSRNGDANLEKFSISFNGKELNVITERGFNLDNNITSSNKSTYRDTALFVSDPGVYTFKVTDKDGESASVDIEVMVGTPLSTEVTGAFFHIEGTSQGSYDLVNNTTVAASGANSLKDMSNTDAAGDPFTGSWTAKNSTMFVKVSSFDYANATAQMAANAYNNGTASASVTDPIVGDFYIAKLRGTSDYAVIKVTNVDPNDNTCNCGNKGKITFDYKKA